MPKRVTRYFLGMGQVLLLVAYSALILNLLEQLGLPRLGSGESRSLMIRWSGLFGLTFSWFGIRSKGAQSLLLLSILTYLVAGTFFELHPFIVLGEGLSRPLLGLVAFGFLALEGFSRECCGRKSKALPFINRAHRLWKLSACLLLIVFGFGLWMSMWAAPLAWATVVCCAFTLVYAGAGAALLGAECLHPLVKFVHSRAIQLASLFAALLVSLALLTPNFIRARHRGALTACKSNLKNIGTACEMYSSDHDGGYPRTLSFLTPNYLKILPECPVAGKVTYTYKAGGTVCNNPGFQDYYFIMCAGEYHTDVSLPQGYPQYDGISGLLER